jgi:glucokinase
MPAKFIVGIDLGGTNLKIALLDLKYRIKYKEVLNTRKFIKKENLISAIIDSINKVIDNNNLSRANILGIGLGLPGPIDYERGVVHFFPNIPGWKEVGLKTILERRLRLPVFVDNDAKLMSLAEYKLGAAKGSRNAVCITLGTGVGGGIILNGNLYRGSSNASGEIGHMPINEKGPRCNCGGRACLETYIGNNRILKEARRMFRRDITLEELSYLARKQNRQAQTIWLKIAGRLAVALVGAVNLLNPDCIVIGGGVAGAGEILFDNIRKIIARQAMSVQARQVKVFKAKLGNNAGLIGAAILVRENIR